MEMLSSGTVILHFMQMVPAWHHAGLESRLQNQAATTKTPPQHPAEKPDEHSDAESSQLPASPPVVCSQYPLSTSLRVGMLFYILSRLGSICLGMACCSISHRPLAVSAKTWHAILYLNLLYWLVLQICKTNLAKNFSKIKIYAAPISVRFEHTSIILQIKQCVPFF